MQSLPGFSSKFTFRRLFAPSSSSSSSSSTIDDAAEQGRIAATSVGTLSSSSSPSSSSSSSSSSQPPPSGDGQGSLLWNEMIYVATGVFQVLGTQFLFYEGAADQYSLLTVSAYFVGMALVFFHPAAHRPLPVDPLSKLEIDSPSAHQREIVYISLVDLAAIAMNTAAIFLAGSSVFQIVYSGLVLFTAMLRKFWLRRGLTSMQWMAILVITTGLMIGTKGTQGANGEFQHRVLIGMVCALSGTGLIAVENVMVERLLSDARDISPIVFCYKIGIVSTVCCVLYLCSYTLPHWNESVLGSIHAHGGNPTTIMVMYVALVFASFWHSIAYFEVVSAIGSVGTSLLSAVRAVLVFVGSGYFFCQLEVMQCFTSYKGLALCVVLLGKATYSFSHTPDLAEVSKGEAISHRSK